MERKRGEVECLIVDQNWKIASKRTFLFSRKMILHTPVVFKEKWGKERQRERDRDRQRENSNSKTLFYEDCSLGSVKNLSNN